MLGFGVENWPTTFEKFGLTYSSASSRVSNVIASVISVDQVSPVQTARLSESGPFGGRAVGASASKRSDPMTYLVSCLRVKTPIKLDFSSLRVSRYE